MESKMKRYLLPKGTPIPVIHGNETAYYARVESDMYTTASSPSKALASFKARVSATEMESPRCIDIAFCDIVAVDI